jgi:hypothetical protein
MNGKVLIRRLRWWKQTSAAFQIVSALMLVGTSCSGDPSDIGKSSANLSSASPPQSQPVLTSPSFPPHLPADRNAKRVFPTAVPDWCPDDKPSRADWTALSADKQKAKTSPAVAPKPVGVPSPALLNQQDTFLNAVEANKGLFATSTPEERDRQYSELKRSYMGE